MQNEQSAIHDLAKLVEDINGQFDKHAKHLIVDAGVPDAHQTWLQRAAQVVEEDFLLLNVKHASILCGLVDYLLVDALRESEQLALQVLRIARLQRRIDAIRECDECATVKTLLAEQAIQHGVHAVEEVGVELAVDFWDRLRLLPSRMPSHGNELLHLDVILLNVLHAFVHEII